MQIEIFSEMRNRRQIRRLKAEMGTLMWYCTAVLNYSFTSSQGLTMFGSGFDEDESIFLQVIYDSSSPFI